MDVDARLRRAIEDTLAKAKGQPFAVFDFDNTCIVNDIGEATLAYLCSHELLKDRTLLGEPGDAATYHERVFQIYHALLGEEQTKAAYMLNARMFSGFTPGEAEAAALAAITEEGSRIGSKMLYGIHIERGLALRPSVLSLMRYVQTRKVHVWIISASPETCVRAAMQHFGIVANLIGVRAIIHDGIFTPLLKTPMPIIEGKVKCMHKYIDASRAPLLVVEDSPRGLPLLETAEIQVVVDRGNEFTDEARKRGWFVL